MTAPEDREALAECDCGHPLWWHHETKGCMSNHHGGRLCWCQVHPDALLARVKREAAAETWDECHEAFCEEGINCVHSNPYREGATDADH